MPLVMSLQIGQGVRFDQTDIWTLREILNDGLAAVFIAPNSQKVTISEGSVIRVGPGLRLSLAAPATPSEVRLIVDAYMPLIHRYPARPNPPRQPVVGGSA